MIRAELDVFVEIDEDRLAELRANGWKESQIKSAIENAISFYPVPPLSDLISVTLVGMEES